MATSISSGAVNQLVERRTMPWRAVHERGAVGAGARRDAPALHEGV